jgi:hypothetical protein
VLRDDLRWGPPPESTDAALSRFWPVDQVEAVTVLDERWARADAVPALD